MSSQHSTTDAGCTGGTAHGSTARVGGTNIGAAACSVAAAPEANPKVQVEVVQAAEALFTSSELRLIQGLEGNDRCCDCRSTDTAWGSVTHGTLLCLSCAGVHRSLGVNVSFVSALPLSVCVCVRPCSCVRIN